MIITSIGSLVVTTVLLLNTAQNPEHTEILFKNKTYRFSFSIPATWEKQSGHPNSNNALFMQMPLANSCRFQFNVTPMTATFPVETVVNTRLASAYRELKLNQLVAAKRRDTWIKVKINEKMPENVKKEKIVLLTRGWEITEKPHKQSQQRIIYQVYDQENHYFNFIAAATSEKFTQCEPELRKIMDSISFISF